MFLASELKALNEFSDFTQIDYESKDDKRRQLERTIENIINATIDMAKIILASQNKPTPSTYREILYQLGFIKGFPLKVTEKISHWVELRNILAHEYLDIRWKRIADFIKNNKPRFQQFIRAAKKIL